MTFKVPENYRVTKGPHATDRGDGNNGAFVLEVGKHGKKYRIFTIASDGMGWEHVSASLPGRCPTWKEMCAIKALFWGDDDVVIQIHPTHDEYVNNHPYCLHLWRKAGTNDFCERPPPELIGLVRHKANELL